MKTFLYLFVMALVTYLIRMIPFVLFRKKVKSEFLKNFFNYIPYAVLAAMTIPWMFESGKNGIAAGIGFIVGTIMSYFEFSLLIVATATCLGAFVAGLFF